MAEDWNRITVLLNRLDGAGEVQARVYEMVYAELRAIAHKLVSQEPAENSYQATELVHETYVKKLRGLRVPAAPEHLGRRRLFADAREGVRVLVQHRLLRALATGQLLAALSAGATSALLVVLAEDHLGATGSQYGLLIGAIGIGAALGPLALLRLIRQPRRPVFV